MAILVEEGLHPNGMDLVRMADPRRLNGATQPPARPQGMPLIALGGDDALAAELKLVASIDPDKGDVVIVVSGLAGRVSSIAGFRAEPMNLGEFARIPVESVRSAISLSLDGPKEVEQ